MTKIYDPRFQALPSFEGITIGADPELFIKDETGKYVSAEGLIPGTKTEPYKVSGGALQVDGMAAEINIDPSSSYNEFSSNIDKVMTELKKRLPKGYSLDASPSVVFDEDVWEKASDVAKQLGCEPDVCAFDGRLNVMPGEDKRTPRMRTGAGHIHIGWTKDEDIYNTEHISNCRDLAMQLDWVLGSWTVTMDKDKRRRELYGKAGAIRYKPYGVEYRVPSNFWLRDETLRLHVWNRVQYAIYKMEHDFFPGMFKEHGQKIIMSCINEGSLDTLPGEFDHPVNWLGTIAA